MSSKRTAYTFATLRYSHDVVAGEFLNLGVIVLGAKGECMMRVTESFMRLRLAFPRCDTIAVKKQLARIEGGIAVAALGANDRTLLSMLRAVLPDEQGSFHWSEIGAGVCLNLKDALNELFERFVSSRGDEKYGEFEDLVSNHIQVRYKQDPQWMQVPQIASNDEWGAMGIAACSAGV